MVTPQHESRPTSTDSNSHSSSHLGSSSSYLGSSSSHSKSPSHSASNSNLKSSPSSHSESPDSQKLSPSSSKSSVSSSPTPSSQLGAQSILHNDANKEKKEGSFGYADFTLFKFMFRYALKYPRILFNILFLMLCYAIVTALPPMLIKVLVDKFMSGDPDFFAIPWLNTWFQQVSLFLTRLFSIQNTLWVDAALIAVIYFGFQALSYWFSYLQNIDMAKLGLYASRDIARDVFVHVQELDMGYHDRNEVGRIFSRLSSDILAIREFLGGQVISNLANVITILMILGFIFALDPWLGLVSLSIIPLILVGGSLGKIKIREYRKEERRLNSQMIAYISENISGIKVTKQTNRELVNLELFRTLNRKVKDASIKSDAVGSILFPFMIFASSLGTALIILVGGYRMIDGAIQLGALLAFLNYNTILFRPIVVLGNLYQQLQDALTGAERVKALLDTPSTVPWNQDLPCLPPIEGKVDFDHLAFSYFHNTPIYEDFNLHVPKGKIIAIVGRTGAGKTTIINILDRLYPYQNGSLRIDDLAIENYNLPSYRKQIVAIPQDFFIFSGSLRHNLMMGNPHATDAQMWQVLEDVGLADMIRRSKDGLDTYLQDRGRRLSMGQRQLLIFAAALLADPKILILDEATSSIDIFNEMKIQKATNLLLANRTAFIIAHRLSTIRNADEILVIDRARIVERGTHDELLAQRGHYYTLIKNQVSLSSL